MVGDADWISMSTIIDVVILAIFSFEVLVKTFAEGFHPTFYFYRGLQGWNVFDWIVVVGSFFQARDRC